MRIQIQSIIRYSDEIMFSEFTGGVLPKYVHVLRWLLFSLPIRFINSSSKFTFCLIVWYWNWALYLSFAVGILLIFVIKLYLSSYSECLFLLAHMVCGSQPRVTPVLTLTQQALLASCGWFISKMNWYASILPSRTQSGTHWLFPSGMQPVVSFLLSKASFNFLINLS